MLKILIYYKIEKILLNSLIIQYILQIKTTK